MGLSKLEKEDIAATIEFEGFDYAFRAYSTFESIKDKKFHKLRKAYIEAADALEKYVEG